MKEPTWLLRSVVEAVHASQIAEHGGLPGLRDAGLLDSALARPKILFTYGVVDVGALAAAYALGLIRKHAFNDGNKRIAFLAAYVFLRINGLKLIAPEDEATATFVDLAAGRISEPELAAWLHAHVTAP